MVVKLFVGGFPLDMDELQLAQLVSPHGDISTIKIVRDKKTRLCKGYAFIEMVDDDSAFKTMEALDGETLGDRQLSIRLATEKITPAPTSYKKIERYDPLKKKRPRRPL